MGNRVSGDDSLIWVVRKMCDSAIANGEPEIMDLVRHETLEWLFSEVG